MILRLDPSRTSNDVDVAYVRAAGEHGLALRELERAMQTDLGDFFSFEVVRVGEDTADLRWTQQIAEKVCAMFEIHAGAGRPAPGISQTSA